MKKINWVALKEKSGKVVTKVLIGVGSVIGAALVASLIVKANKDEEFIELDNNATDVDDSTKEIEE